MKFFILCLSSLLLFSCGEPEEDTVEVDPQNMDIFKGEDKKIVLADPNAPGKYEEFHPNGQIKISGINDDNGKRTGLWQSFYENGIKWSESYYVNGKRDGHSITFFPNGKVRYIGEYKNDKQIGEWEFYDEEGKLTSQENYGK